MGGDPVFTHPLRGTQFVSYSGENKVAGMLDVCVAYFFFF